MPVTDLSVVLNMCYLSSMEAQFLSPSLITTK